MKQEFVIRALPWAFAASAEQAQDRTGSYLPFTLEPAPNWGLSFTVTLLFPK